MDSINLAALKRKSNSQKKGIQTILKNEDELSQQILQNVRQLSDGFEHSFPTSQELLDPTTEQKARKHMSRLLSKLNVDAKNRMRDPHLLLYIKKYIDALSFKILSHFVFAGTAYACNRLLNFFT